MPLRLDALTGLRWWAAFWVFAFHLRNLLPIPEPLSWPLDYGYLGVTFFFVLSGFVLTWSSSAELPTSTFYVRRFARIWPAHIVALLLSIPVFYSFAPNPAQDWVKPVDLPVLALSVPVVQGWSLDPMVLFSGNPVAWTLSCEFFFYLLHPLFMLWMRRGGRSAGLVLASASLVVLVALRVAGVVDPGTLVSALPYPVADLPEFTIGIGIAWAIRCGWRPRVPVWLATLLLAGGFAWLSIGPRHLPDFWLTPYPDVLVTVLSAVMMLALAMRGLEGRRSWLEHPVMVRLGTWSFCFYLVHSVVIYGVLNVVGRDDGGWSMLPWAVGVFAVSLALAYGVHRVVEAPAERGIRQWKSRRDLRRRSAAPA